jgi:hypothetical protein
MRQGKAAVYFLLLGVLGAGRGGSQVSTGQISGFARDATGAVVPSVDIRITNKAIGVTRSAVTNESGYYIIASLPAGTYEVTGELAGFNTFVESGIRLDPGAAIAIDIKLNVGAVAERLEVTAALQTVTTDNAQVGRLVAHDQLQELPVGGRSFVNLVGLQAGVTFRGSGFNTFNFNPGGVYSWNVNGQQAHQNYWQLDGVVNNRSRNNMEFNGTVSIDAVQEVQIVTSGFKAEYGRSSGAQINFITKSGTDDFHGAAYWYNRNDKFDARGFFAPRKEHLRWNNFGWNAGGPVYIPGKWNTDKSRLFFFFSQEWHRYRAGSVSLGYVPPLELREGNFNAPYRLAGQPAPIDPLTAMPFPGNLIPKTRLSRNGQAFAKVFPPPTYPNVYVGNNRLTQLLSTTDTLLHTVRVDYNRWNSRFSVRLNHIDSESLVPTGDVIALEGYYRDLRPKKGATLQVTTTVSPSLVNEFTFGAAADMVRLTSEGAGYDRRNYGIDFPYFFGAGSKMMPEKIPDVSVSGIASFSARSYPTHSSGPIYQWRDNLTKIFRGHTVKTGFFVEYSGQNDFDMVAGRSQNGIFTFAASRANPLTTGNSMADMLIGNYDTYVEIGQRAYVPWRSTLVEAYVQDSWKMRPDFNLEYGIRWSHLPRFHSPYNNFLSFNPTFYDRSRSVAVRPDGSIVPGSGFLYNGLTLPGEGWPEAAIGRVRFADDPVSQELFHNLPSNFTAWRHLWAPRLGFAWDVGGRHKTAVRGGFGVFYDFHPIDDYLQPGGKPPLQPQVDISNGPVDTPGAATAGVPIYPLEGAMVDPVSKNPVNYNWSLGVQRSLLPNLTVEVTYVGILSRHQYGGMDYNQPQLGTTFANPGRALNSLRPFPGFSTIRFMENAYNANYNGLQVTITRRLASGLHFGAAYTWSKAMTETDGYGEEALNRHSPHEFRYGRARHDRLHVLNLSYSYTFPFFRGRRDALGAILGGWQLSGLTLFQSGTPLNLTVSGDISGTGKGSRPVWISNPNLPGSERTLTRYFDTQAITRPANGTWGNLGRNILTGPGTNNWDLALLKNFQLREQIRLQFRSEWFNAFNHPQFTSVSTAFGTGNFGYVTGAAAPRVIQFGLRLQF